MRGAREIMPGWRVSGRRKSGGTDWGLGRTINGSYAEYKL
jgi:hypothetical protein